MIKRGSLKIKNKKLNSYKTNKPNIGSSVNDFWEKWESFYENKFQYEEIPNNLK